MASSERRAVVTGAARGIGRAVTEQLLREGVDVLAVDVEGTRLKDVAALGCDLAGRVRRAAEEGGRPSGVARAPRNAPA
jgi:meso-butanediol dehydrogenase / (S,S)-butanediol dehydrogenase / diacetyl reductase